MGKILDHLAGLIAKQIEDRGMVVWFDPERVYQRVIENLLMPETKLFCYKDSLFKLRHAIDSYIEYVNEKGGVNSQGHVPPRLLIYVPKAQDETHHALIEYESAGVVMEPGANPWQRNTRLRVITEQVFKKVAPESAAEIARQVEAGQLSFEEVDKLSTEIESYQSRSP